MDWFDLHCDTVYECLRQGKGLGENDLHLDLRRGIRAFDRWVQTFAFWIPDGLSEWEQFELYRQELACFREQEKKNAALVPYEGAAEEGKCSYLLAVEGGSVLGDDLHRLTGLKEDGIRLLTLTWNGANRIGGGAKSGERLTAFGKAAVRETERLGILIDVSHLNRETFWDVCNVAQKPFLATHSNADAVCPQERNLTEEQIREICSRGGLIGLNLYPPFVTGGQTYQPADFLRQIEYFLRAGAAAHLAIGTDFDGAAMPAWINGAESIEILRQSVVEWFGEKICRAIFYENAARFYQGLLIE